MKETGEKIAKKDYLNISFPILNVTHKLLVWKW